jgi:hypothetical protein
MRLLFTAALCFSVFCTAAFSQKTKKEDLSFYGVIKVKRNYKKNTSTKDPNENFTVNERANSTEEWTFNVFFYRNEISDVDYASLVKEEEDMPNAVPVVSKTKQTTNLQPLINDDDLPEAVPLVSTSDRVTARVTASGDSYEEKISVATNTICWKENNDAVHGVTRTVTTVGKSDWTANQAMKEKADLIFLDKGIYVISLSAVGTGNINTEQFETIKSPCENKKQDEQKNSFVIVPISIDFVSTPFNGTPNSERLTGKEILVLENGTMEVQWELKRRK